MDIIADKETRKGVINAILAYCMWGVAPLYFKLLVGIGADEILIHRILWASLLLMVLIFAMKKTRSFFTLVNDTKALGRLAITSVVLAFNWLVFIWAVNNDHLLDASLGYFINPLFSVALGMLFLGERLRFWQKIAVGCAFVGVLIQLVMLGSLPVISLTLAASFGIYGLLRKQMKVDSLVGLLVETVLMLPLALIYWYLFIDSPTSDMTENSLSLNATLMLAGVVTTAPLLCFTAAAKRLTLSALGFLQYIGPSIMFILAILLYNEPLAPAKLATFVFIWLALAVYSCDTLNAKRQRDKAKLL